MTNVGKSIRRRLAVCILPGGLLLGTSCAESVRESVVSGSLGFVEDTTVMLLETLTEAFVPAGE